MSRLFSFPPPEPDDPMVDVTYSNSSAPSYFDLLQEVRRLRDRVKELEGFNRNQARLLASHYPPWSWRP